MGAYGLIACAPMIGLVALAAAGDVRARRIPNWLTLGLMLTGLAQSFMPVPAVAGGGWSPLLGLLTGFAAAFVLFGLGGLCGGDVKLMAGVGAWLGPWPVLLVFAAATGLGSVIVLVQAVVQGRARVLLRDSAVVAMSLAHAGEVGLSKAVETGQACAPSAAGGNPRPGTGRMLPFAVPVLLASLVVLAMW